MIAPRWVATLAQPIAIEDLVEFLVAAAELPVECSQVYEIGGADQVSYGDIMREYARPYPERRKSLQPSGPRPITVADLRLLFHRASRNW